MTTHFTLPFLRLLPVTLLLCLLYAAIASRAMTAVEMQPVVKVDGGFVQIISPSPEAMRYTNGRNPGTVLLYHPDTPGQRLTVTLPVPASGYYKVTGTHVFGAWKQGRYALVYLDAEGIRMPGKQHGWYGPDGPPAHWPKSRTHLVDVSWGVIYLHAPAARLSFVANDEGAMGIADLTLTPVAANTLTEAERARRAPAPLPVEASNIAAPAPLAVRDLGPISWTLPVAPRAITVDGKLAEWDLRTPAVTASVRTIDKLGWATPAPQGDADLSAIAHFAWDADRLYLAARVTDDELAETAGQKEWASPWGHDSVVLRILPPAWLRGGPRAVGQVADDMHLGFSFYSPNTAPRPLPAGITYAATRTKDGYDIEAAMPFSTLGFRADAGDRIPAMLILSDIDPGKAPALRFDQYGLPTRGFGDRQVAQLRLISADGWGADWSFDAEELTPGTPVQLLGYLDIFDRPRQLTGVELTGPNGVVLRQALPVAVMLSPGHRYLMTGGITLPADAPAGRYTPRTILTK